MVQTLVQAANHQCRLRWISVEGQRRQHIERPTHVQELRVGVNLHLVAVRSRKMARRIMTVQATPQIVTREEWERARAELLVREMAYTHAGDALN